MSGCGISRVTMSGTESVSQVVMCNVSIICCRYFSVSNAMDSPNAGAKPCPVTRIDVSTPPQGKLVYRCRRAVYFFGERGKNVKLRHNFCPRRTIQGSDLPEHSETVKTF